MKKERDLFSIGEVARALNITRRAILYYEEFGLIRPDVKDGATGNRYYTIDTFTKLRSIRSLQNLGLTLDEIRDYYNDSTDLMPLIRRMEEMRDVLGYFDGDFALAPLIRRLEAQRDELDRHIESLRERSGAEPPQVKLVRLLPQTVYRRVYAAVTVAERTTLLRSTALEGMRLYGTDISHRMYLVESPIDKPDQVAFCVAIPPESRGEYVETLPAAPALSLYHHGAYEQLPAVVKQLLTSAREQGLTPAGTIRRIYLEGPPQHKDPAKFITQVLLPVLER